MIIKHKRILIYRWRAYNYLDVRETFLQMGFEVEEIRQDLESYDVNDEFAELLIGKLKTDKYDFVFTINYFPVISDVCQELGIPYISWSCDNPLISMYHKSVYNEVNRIFTFDMTNLREFQGMGVKNIYYLPLAVDSGRIRAVLDDSGDLSAYRNEISFVGSLYEKNSYDRMEYKLPDYLRGYLDAVMQIQSDTYGSNVIEGALTPDILQELQKYFKLEKSEDSLSDLGLIFSVTTLGFKVAQIQRKRDLLALSHEHPVTLYSNSDTSDLITVSYRGSLDYWTEMPRVFAASRINLNFTIPNIKSGIPLRVWDILGAGGFCLTNFQAELPMYFKDGEDLAWFYGSEDLLEKAGFYLEHEEERKRIAQRGLEKVKEHDFHARIREMLMVSS